MTPEELKQLAQSLIAELRSSEKLAIGGAAVFKPPRVTSCTCDGACGCNSNCKCEGKGSCTCNSMCPCDSKSIPAEVEWQINPDPGLTRAITTLNASESPKEMITILRNIRVGMRAQGRAVD
jgi:hypothetical protein